MSRGEGASEPRLGGMRVYTCVHVCTRKSCEGECETQRGQEAHRVGGHRWAAGICWLRRPEPPAYANTHRTLTGEHATPKYTVPTTEAALRLRGREELCPEPGGRWVGGTHWGGTGAPLSCAA